MPRQPNPQNRLACDRCHGQKLRCPHREGQGPCQRCLRQNATCVFSPRQKRTSPADMNKKRQSQQQAQPESGPQLEPHEEQENDDPMDLTVLDPSLLDLSPDLISTIPVELANCDWSNIMGPGFEQPDLTASWEFPLQPNAPSAQFGDPTFLQNMCQPDCSNPSGSSSNTDSSTPATTPSSSTTDTIDPDNISNNSSTNDGTPTLSTSIRQLADLNVRLYDQYHVLPPLCDPDAVPDEAALSSSRLRRPLIAIDEIFRATQTLIDIMVRFYPRDGGLAAKILPDAATLLMLLSCTDRVFDIFELLFGHMRGCLLKKVLPVTADGRIFSLPELRIGSYKPPAMTEITVHMLTTILMASHLFDQLQEVLGVGRGHGGGGGGGGEPNGNGGGDGGVVLAHPIRGEVELVLGKRSRFPDFTNEAKAAITQRAKSVAQEIIHARIMVLSLPGMWGTSSFVTPFREPEAQAAKD